LDGFGLVGVGALLPPLPLPELGELSPLEDPPDEDPPEELEDLLEPPLTVLFGEGGEGSGVNGSRVGPWL
jgi:hypothetical protein